MRAAKARAALRPAGVLALFWNSPAWENSPHRAALLEAYESVGADWEAVGGAGPMYPLIREPFPARGYEEDELRESPGFGEPERRLYNWPHTYTSAEYVQLVSTHCDHVSLADAQRRALLHAIAHAIDAIGGELQVPYITALILARAV